MVSTTISLDNKTPSSTSDSCSRSVIVAAANPAVISQHHHRSSSNSNNTTYNSGGAGGGSVAGYYNSVLPASTTVVQKFDSASSLNEKISILFPKCRPKGDINLNHPVHINTMMTSPATSSLSSESSSTAAAIGSASKSPNISTNPFLSRHPTEKISYYYKTKDDYGLMGGGNSGGVGAIGGGSSGGFQPNSAVPTYTQKLLSQKQHVQQYQLSPLQQHSGQQQQQHLGQQMVPASVSLQSSTSSSHSPSQYHSSQNPFINRDSFSSQWEARKRMVVGTPNTTPVSTVLNSPDLIEAIDARVGQYQKSAHHIRVGRSPVSHATGGAGGDVASNKSVEVVTPTNSSMAVVADGEVVVFDDIGENWQNLRITTESSGLVAQPQSLSIDQSSSLLDRQQHSPQPPSVSQQKQQSQLIAEQQDYAGSLLRPKYHQQSTKIDNDYLTERSYATTPDRGDSLKGISGIMEYDGSPRRFGQPQNAESSMIYSQQPSNTAQSSKMSSMYTTPRPGFPQRIIMTSHDATSAVPAPTAATSVVSPSLVDTTTSTRTDETNNEVNDSPMTIATEPTVYEQPLARSSTFDYLYEFSETRKVLEEFFKCPVNDDKVLENGSDVDSIDIHYEFKGTHDQYIGQRLASSPFEEYAPEVGASPKQNGYAKETTLDFTEPKDLDFFLESASRSSAEVLDNEPNHRYNHTNNEACYRYSPETTDYDSNCGDLDSLSGDFNVSTNYPTNYSKYYASMPILEDGLSSGHASDTENNNPTGISLVMDMRQPIELEHHRQVSSCTPDSSEKRYNNTDSNGFKRDPGMQYIDDFITEDELRQLNRNHIETRENVLHSPKNKIFKNIDPELDSLYSISMVQLTPPPPAPAPHRKPSVISCSSPDVQATLKDIKTTLERTKTLISPDEKRTPIAADNLLTSPTMCSPIWIPRHFENSAESMESESALNKNNASGDEDEVDTDLETDRLLGHQRLEDHGFYEDKNWCDRKPRSLLSSSLSKFSPKIQPNSTTNGVGNSIIRQGLNALMPTTPETATTVSNNANNTNSSTSKLLDIGGSLSSPEHSDKSPIDAIEMPANNDSPTGSTGSNKDIDKKKKSKNKEVLIEGVLFRARYLGSTQLVCEGQPTKSTRMVQAEEAVSRIKAPDGEVQPSTEVDLFISTEKIMVLNTDLKEIMMDHALRTISYIADIGDLVVLMARRRFVPNEIDDAPKPNRTPKMICHVFESDEAQFIAQSIGQAFQVAYMEFLKANGIEDHSFVKEMDYQEVLNSQEIFGDELEIFAKKELQKEVVVPKAKGEILGVVIVESGWGSMLPTVVIANLLSSGAAARCGQLNIGDQIIAINGMSLVGLPLSTCQTYIKNTKTQTVVKFTVVPCAPVVEVKIKRPNTKYQLGFSVQNGVICSLLRGGIAERGGVRVGHRIIEINNQSVVAVPHEKIVNLLATSVGEILMKTMPTSMFRLLTGQENPVYI